MRKLSPCLSLPADFFQFLDHQELGPVRGIEDAEDREEAQGCEGDAFALLVFFF